MYICAIGRFIVRVGTCARKGWTIRTYKQGAQLSLDTLFVLVCNLFCWGFSAVEAKTRTT